MNREVHVRFWESPEVKVLRATRPFDLDDYRMVEKTIEQRGGNDGVTEDLTPFGKAAVRGEDHGAALVAGVDELEEQIAAA